MREFDLQMGLAAEMARIMADAGREDREVMRDPARALEILRRRAPSECSATYGDIDVGATEALAMQLFFSIFWGEKLDIHCGPDGRVVSCQIASRHCTDQACCGPLPLWQEETTPHHHRH